MSLFRRIEENVDLLSILTERCEEQGVCVEIDARIGRDSYLILKVDNYYNGLNVDTRPASPDCLIIQKCTENRYSINIIELKKMENSQHLLLENTIEKFKTCLDDFISIRFKDILFRDYADIRLYFISNIELYKRDMGLKMRALMGYRFLYRGEKYMIQPKMSSPIITPCY